MNGPACTGRLPTVTFPNAIVVPVLDPSAQTPYLTGPNNDIIPQASLGGHTPQTAGWLSIPLVDPNRAGSPTVIVTQDLTGMSTLTRASELPRPCVLESLPLTLQMSLLMACHACAFKG